MVQAAHEGPSSVKMFHQFQPIQNCNHYLHNTHPLSSASKFLTIRMHLLDICSIGSTPVTLPAATAFELC